MISFYPSCLNGLHWPRPVARTTWATRVACNLSLLVALVLAVTSGCGDQPTRRAASNNKPKKETAKKETSKTESNGKAAAKNADAAKNGRANGNPRSSTAKNGRPTAVRRGRPNLSPSADDEEVGSDDGPLSSPAYVDPADAASELFDDPPSGNGQSGNGQNGGNPAGPATGDSAPASPPTAAPAAPARDLTARESELSAAKAKVLAASKAPAGDASDNEESQREREKVKEQLYSDLLGLIDEAIAADDFAVANRAVASAQEVGGALDDQELATEAAKAKRRVQQYETAFRKVAAARQTLSTGAADAQANYTVGSYLCYLKGDWDAGLVSLAKGGDAAARKAAELDLAASKAVQESSRSATGSSAFANSSTTAAAQQAADAWWNIAGKENAIAKAHVMLRARKWYDSLRSTLDADAQEKLRGRIEMIDKYAVSSGVNIELGLDAELPEASGKLTMTQRGRVQKLLADFRRSAGNPGQLEATANKLLTIGGPAVSQLLVEVNKIIQPQLAKYGEEFQRQAAAVQASRGGANSTEVDRLRKQVLALKELPNLTKDMIVQQGDPAMDKLKEMLVVDRQMVLERSARLRDERKRLLVLGRQWERCTQALLKTIQEEQARTAKTRKPAKKELADGKSSDGKAADGKMATEKMATEKMATEKMADDASPSTPQPPSFEKYLEGEEEMAAKMTMPMDESARAVLAANAKLLGQIETEEARAILACNLTRQLLGLSALKIDLKLCSAARDHSKDMATLNFFAHESPVPGKTTPWDRAKNFGTSASGENIAMGYSDGNAANQGWFHSPGHHKNMLGGHSRIGLGVHKAHYTELFGN